MTFASGIDGDLTQKFFRDFPTDPRTVLRFFDFEPVTISLVCCPSCFCLYPLSEDTAEKCTNENVPGKVCGAGLFKRKKTLRGRLIRKPIRCFVYQPFPEWLGRFLSRPGIEDLVDRPLSIEDPQEWQDIGDARALRELLWSDGLPFLPREGETFDGEGRYVFAFNIDWLNPRGNKQSGKQESLGAMYMVCLNLPVRCRYKFENVYLVGIIPTPSEPSTHQTNHVTRPLIDHLVPAWEHGIRLTRTHNYPNGRSTKSALVPLVADLPAARKTSGHLSASSANFCSFCSLQACDSQNLDYKSWKRRSPEKHRELADEWLRQTSGAARTRLQTATGVRWSEFLRLIYWDPTRYTLVEPMHALLLRDIMHHGRTLFGMGKECPEGDGEFWLYCDAKKAAKGRPRPAGGDAPKPQKGTVEWAQHVLHHGTDKGLARLTNPLLDALYRSTLPSWIGRIQRRIGVANQGKLKADEWQGAGTIHFPITLIRLWARKKGRYREMLENFIHLAAAVMIATMRTQNQARADQYTTHFLSYLKGLKTLYPRYKWPPTLHLSLHIPEFISLFGPVYSWWAFPFERYNGAIQKIPTNFK
ncbi:hypothetical protein BOTBODRAFT_121839, partial [Botryobasidium botryosum FD-172 SS1]